MINSIFGEIFNFDIVKLAKERLHLLIIFVSTMALYIFTMPQTVTMEDSGSFIMTSYFMGIDHPPGYPLYTLLGKLFTFIPLGSIAFRVHMMSACFAALTSILIYLIVLMITNRSHRLLGYLAAFLYAFSESLWSQAIIAEVYTLNTFLFFLLFFLCLLYNIQKSSIVINLIAFIYGLSLTNHWPLIQLSLPALLMILWPHRWEILKKLPQMCFFFVLGLSPYVYMYYRSKMDPLFTFQGPISNLEELWYFISRKNYAQLENSTSASWIDKLNMAKFVSSQIMIQCTYLGGASAMMGFVVQWKMLPKSLCSSLSFIFLGGTFLLVSLLNVDFDDFWGIIFRVYPLIPYGVMVIWIVLALKFLVDRIKGISIQNKNHVLFGCSVFLVLFTLIQNFDSNNRRHYTWAADFAKVTLNSLDKDAIFFTHQDWDVGSLGYLNLVEEFRQDVTLYNDKALGFSNRLFKGIKPSRADQKESLYKFIKSSNRSIYYVNELMPNPYLIKKNGHYQQVIPDADAGEMTEFKLNELIFDYYMQIASSPEPKDPLSRIHRWMLMGKMTATLIPVLYGGDRETSLSRENDKKYTKLFELVSAHFLGKIRMVDSLLLLGFKDADFMLKALDEAELLLDQCVHKSNRARIPSLRARVKSMQNDSQGYLKHLKESFEIYPNKDNVSGKMILRYLEGKGRILEALDFKKKYPFISDSSK